MNKSRACRLALFLMFSNVIVIDVVGVVLLLRAKLLRLCLVLFRFELDVYLMRPPTVNRFLFLPSSTLPEVLQNRDEEIYVGYFAGSCCWANFCFIPKLG